MENKSTARKVLLVFAVIFSVIFTPCIIAVAIAGAGANGVASVCSEKELSNVVKESGIFDSIIATVESEVTERMPDQLLTPAGYSTLIQGLVTSEDLEVLYDEIVASFFSGNAVHIDFAPIKAKIDERVESLVTTNLDDFFYSWKDGRSSSVFSKELLSDMDEVISDSLNVRSEEEARQMYIISGRSEPYDEYLMKEWENIKLQKDFDIHDNQFDIDNEIMDIEQEVSDEINKVFSERDLRRTVKYLNILDDNRGVLPALILLIEAIFIIILLVLYVFQPAGFFVSGVALMLGGGLCMLANLILSGVRTLVTDTIASEFPAETATELLSSAMGLVNKLIDKVMDGFIGMGGMVLIFGVVMIGLGILRVVLLKNKAAEA